MSNAQLDLFAPPATAVPVATWWGAVNNRLERYMDDGVLWVRKDDAYVRADETCWCVASDLWAAGRYCEAARKLEASRVGTLDHSNALRVVASIQSAGGFHCDGEDCGTFTTIAGEWDGLKLCATCRQPSVCDSCEREHHDGKWLVCDDCDESLLRAWLKWNVDIVTSMRLVGACAATRLFNIKTRSIR